MPKGFPTCSSKQLLKIIKKHCGEPIRKNGSHQTFHSPYTKKNFTFAPRKKDFKSGLVRKILIQDIGLTEEQALKEVQ